MGFCESLEKRDLWINHEVHMSVKIIPSLRSMVKDTHGKAWRKGTYELIMKITWACKLFKRSFLKINGKEHSWEFVKSWRKRTYESIMKITWACKLFKGNLKLVVGGMCVGKLFEDYLLMEKKETCSFREEGDGGALLVIRIRIYKP